jgi:flagellar hook-associated protein 1 FlgK
VSLSSILSIANSGLQTAERGMNVVSDNIANVGTAGYVRRIAEQAPVATDNVGTGVRIVEIRRAADQFLQQASLIAQADSGKAGIVAGLYDQAQGLFGDPSSDNSFFSSLDTVFKGFASLAATPSATQRAQALSNVTDLFSQASTIAVGLQNLGKQADSRINGDIEQINQLLTQVNDLNVQISRGTVAGKDTTGSENQQSLLVDQLAKLMDIKTTPHSPAGITVRASDGLILAGEGAAVLRYDATGPTGEVMITSPGGVEQSFGSRLTSGELEGLLKLRNTGVPELSSQLSELASQVADQLNSVSNAYSAVPAPATLTGRNTGLDLPTAVSNFTGKTSVAIVNAAGVIQQRVDIDFTAATMSANGGPASGFTPANFLASLNTALGGAGTAAYGNFGLSIGAAGAGAGVAIADDPTTPSSKAGRGFSAYFGLNDLVRSSVYSNYDTGLTLSDPHGFTPGQTVTFRVAGQDGASIRDIAVAVPSSGTTMGSLVSALNAPVGGVGLYGSFALDANGRLGFTPATGSGVTLSVVQDTTARGSNGPALTSLFGIGDSTRANRTASFSIRSDIAQNPARLPGAKLNLGAAAGAAALAVGDNRGADAFSQAGQQLRRFHGPNGPFSMTLSDYAASFGGSLGRAAANAASAKSDTDQVAQEAQSRRTSAEGVNLDEELVNLTTYQQAYSASARMIQAAKDMYDVLLNMVR